MENGKTNSRIAIFLMFGNVEGGGGIERYFVNFSNLIQSRTHLDIITTAEGKKNIKRVFPHYPPDNIRIFPLVNNRFSTLISKAYLYYLIKRNRYEIIHIANYDAYFHELYLSISKYTKVTLNIIDCRFSPEVEHTRYFKIKEFIRAKCLSGILSWYSNTESVIRAISPEVKFKAIDYCFTDIQKFKPGEKKKQVVFAARLSVFKRPLDYLDAVSILLESNPQLKEEWEFLLYGDGELADSVQHRIDTTELKNVIRRGVANDMSPVFNASSIFVSTQMYENFTSLSMLEAMSSGNAIVSYNVGETIRFVRPGQNGLLIPESPVALASALLHLMRDEEKLNSFQQESTMIARTVHTFENFSEEIIDFWKSLPAHVS